MSEMEARILERDVVRGCLEFLQYKGIMAWRQNSGAIPTGKGGYRSFRGMPGQSDIIGVLAGGRFLAIEAKRPKGGRLSPEQETFLDRVSDLGGLALVVRSTEELEADLKEAGII